MPCIHEIVCLSVCLLCVCVQLLCVDVSGSGGLGVCSAEDGKLWVWDADTGETRVCTLNPISWVYIVVSGHPRKIWQVVERSFSDHFAKWT